MVVFFGGYSWDVWMKHDGTKKRKHSLDREELPRSKEMESDGKWMKVGESTLSAAS